MAHESVDPKRISLKDSLSKVPLRYKPIIEFFAGCIDKHPELSLAQKTQWLTFVTSEYEPRGTIRKPKGYSEVSKILGIPEREIGKHMDALGDFPGFDTLWEKLKKEIDEETKKNPKLFKSSRVKEVPIPQEIIDEVIEQRTKTKRTNPVIAQMVGLSGKRFSYLVRKLTGEGKVPARGHTKSSPTVQS